MHAGDNLYILFHLLDNVSKEIHFKTNLTKTSKDRIYYILPFKLEFLI